MLQGKDTPNKLSFKFTQELLYYYFRKFMDPRGRQSSDREKQFEIAARLVAKSQCNSWIAEDNGSPTGISTQSYPISNHVLIYRS